ncbi:MAG: hypothetical protein V4598_06205 [Bdellovibrionota bacterium]
MRLKPIIMLILASFLIVSCNEKEPREKWTQERQEARGDEAQSAVPHPGRGDFGAADEEKLDNHLGNERQEESANQRLENEQEQ